MKMITEKRTKKIETTAGKVIQFEYNIDIPEGSGARGGFEEKNYRARLNHYISRSALVTDGKYRETKWDDEEKAPTVIVKVENDNSDTMTIIENNIETKKTIIPFAAKTEKRKETNYTDAVLRKKYGWNLDWSSSTPSVYIHNGTPYELSLMFGKYGLFEYICVENGWEVKKQIKVPRKKMVEYSMMETKPTATAPASYHWKNDPNHEKTLFGKYGSEKMEFEHSFEEIPEAENEQYIRQKLHSVKITDPELLKKMEDAGFCSDVLVTKI